MSKWVLLLMVALPSITKAQKISIIASNKELVEILGTIEKQAGVYFSYDPELFAKEPKYSINYQNTILQTVLIDLLGSKYKHERVGDYIVISLQKDMDRSPSTPLTNARSKSAVIDTIKIEKVIYVYDTLQVVLTEKIFDTIRVNRTEIVYDTVRVERITKKFAWAPYVSFFQWTGSSKQLLASQIYTGIAVGLSREFTVNNRVSLMAGIQYSQQFQNVKIPGDSSVTFSVDTIQQYPSNRINQLNLLRLKAGFIFQLLKVNKALTMDVEIGFSMFKAIKTDEILIRQDGSVIESQLRDHRHLFYTIAIATPLTWHMSQDFSITVQPFVERGLNKYKIKDVALRSSVVGVALKFKCF